MTRDEVLKIVLDHNNSLRKSREKLMLEYGHKYKEEISRREMDECLKELDKIYKPVTIKTWDGK